MSFLYKKMDSGLFVHFNALYSWFHYFLKQRVYWGIPLSDNLLYKI